MLKQVCVVVMLALAIPAAVSVILWTVKDPKTVYVTEIINRIPDTQYCYTSEDGDWLICRLKEGK